MLRALETPEGSRLLLLGFPACVWKALSLERSLVSGRLSQSCHWPVGLKRVRETPEGCREGCNCPPGWATCP
jgi:hypothetical protein